MAINVSVEKPANHALVLSVMLSGLRPEELDALLLAKVLTKIADGGINLSKLQSFPIQGSDFKYAFHADMEFDSISQFENVIDAIKPLTESIKIYGVYKRGLWK